LHRRALEELPSGKVILAGGPLVGGGVERELRRLCGNRFYFYDAIAPIVDADSIDWAHAFRGSRYGKGNAADEPSEGDYVNCTLSEPEYRAFVQGLRSGQKVPPHPFEEPRYFEGCLPIEIMAERGEETLAFGPMKPVGLDTNAYAVVQLRAESRYLTSYNLVGFQTRLTYPEQKRVFSLIPALKNAEWVRFGSIHRNAYIESHRLLGPHFQLKARPDLYLAGQLTGVEGYIESTAIGLLVGMFIAGELRGIDVAVPPLESAFGALYSHALRPRAPKEPFQPSNINFGLMPPLPYQKGRHGKRDRRLRHVERARVAHEAWTKSVAAQ